MIDEMRRQAALAEADNALAVLRSTPPADRAARRQQMARAANQLIKAAAMLDAFTDEDVA